MTLKEEFDIWLSHNYPDVRFNGVTYSHAQVMKKLAPEKYESEFREWVDNEISYNKYYLSLQLLGYERGQAETQLKRLESYQETAKNRTKKQRKDS